MISSEISTNLNEVNNTVDFKEIYKDYRKRLVELHVEILDKVISQDDFKKSAAILGILNNGCVTIESDSEKDVLYDFNIYGNIRDGKSSLAEYIDRYARKDEKEEELLKAMRLSDALLYEIVEINKKDGFIILKDVFNSTESIRLIDIGISASLKQKVLLFTRVIQLDGFAMTSGLVFMFSLDHKHYLINRSLKLSKKSRSGDASVDRFVSFFQLNRSDGIPAQYEKVQ